MVNLTKSTEVQWFLETGGRKCALASWAKSPLDQGHLLPSLVSPQDPGSLDWMHMDNIG